MEQVLVLYHARLQLWAQTMARQDGVLAEDIVQDLCVALCLSPPDLSLIENLEAYLYTALRHVHLAQVQRARRDRVKHLSIDEYDSVLEALSMHTGDALDAQNDLLRLCSYMAWRRRWSKSASQFLLHFLHGYHRHDVAKLSRAPIQAVYNNLADVRVEIRQHLTGQTRARLLKRSPPRVTLLRVAETSEVFLRRLRAFVFNPEGNCHPKARAAFIASYASPAAKPVAVNELAHLSGCELCLRGLEDSLSIDDHDGPLDLPGGSDFSETSIGEAQRAIHLVRLECLRLLHRRPSILSLLVNGNEEATFPAEAFRNRMASIRRDARQVDCVQIVDEAGNCLLYQQFGPNSGVDVGTVTKLALSDDRVLDLQLRLRGPHLDIDSSYCDPSLQELRSSAETRRGSVSRPSAAWPFPFSPVWRVCLAGALLASVVGISWYASRHNETAHHPEVASILSHAINAELKPDASSATHQIVAINDDTDPARPVSLGFVESWEDLHRGQIWNLYDSKKQKIAGALQAPNQNVPTIRREPSATAGSIEQAFLSSGVWLDAFTSRELKDGRGLRASTVQNGYALDMASGGRNGVGRRQLLLDANYQVKEEAMRLDVGGVSRSVRLVRTTLTRVPLKSFPSQQGEPGKPSSVGPDSATLESPLSSESEELEIAVLFDLFQAHLDIGQPIAVRRTVGGHVVLEGVVSDSVALTELRKSLRSLAQQNLLNEQLQFAGSIKVRAGRTSYGRLETLGSDSSSGPGVGAVKELLRNRGLNGAALNQAAQEYMNQAVEHADLLLQHASALQRLGQVFGNGPSQSLDLQAKQQWAVMVEAHSRAESEQTEALQIQLQPLSTEQYVPWARAEDIRNASAFRRISSDLLRKAQQVHAATLLFFSESGFTMSKEAVSAAHLLSMLPVNQERQLALFATAMSNTEGKLDSIGSHTPRP